MLFHVDCTNIKNLLTPKDTNTFILQNIFIKRIFLSINIFNIRIKSIINLLIRI